MRGSIIKRCRKCRASAQSELMNCNHKEFSYHLRFRNGGKQHSRMVGNNKKEAERILAETVSAINHGTFRAPSRMLFQEFADKWLREYARGSVKESTYLNYKNMTNHRLIPFMGKLLLEKISPETIQRFKSEHRTQIHPKTINNHLVLLKTMFRQARRLGYIRENPAQDIENERVEHEEMDFLSPEEIKLLLNHSDEPFKTLFMTASLTGMRRGEVLGLQWGDIDWHSNLIYVRRSLYWPTHEISDKNEKRWKFVNPKSQRSLRAIALPGVLKEALELHKLVCPVSPHDLVFCTKEGKPLDPDNMVKREFLPALERAGLRRIRFHDLRHSHCALLIAQNAPIKAIQSQLGHASVQTTLDRYGHLMPQATQDIATKIDLQWNESRKSNSDAGRKSCSPVVPRNKNGLRPLAVTH